MTKFKSLSRVFLAFLVSVLIFNSGYFELRHANFASAADDEIDELTQEIEQKKTYVDQLNRKIDEYRDEIEQKQQEAATLIVETEILENRIATTELEIEALNEEIEAVNLELRLIDRDISELTDKLEQQKQILIIILREIEKYDDQTALDVIFGNDSFSEMFDQLQYLEDINSDLKDAVDKVHASKAALEGRRTEQEGKIASLEDLQNKLSKQVALLENEKAAKDSLVLETQESEAKFAALLYELRQEQQYIDRQISVMQSDIEKKLYENDEIGDMSALSWPFYPKKGISAYFHDTTYPYRHLFEHPGIDLPAPVGTPVGSAAPGYVAWTRTGNMYGNYVMVVHLDGIATLYAHLSKISVQADQFVARGETIGLSGGRPGMPGAGLSTGPHLHFEVRKNGIPVNPISYLISL